MPFATTLKSHGQLAHFFDTLESITPSQMLQAQTQMLEDVNLINFEPTSTSGFESIV